jgi:replicative DNA helicase Mcm
MEFDPSDAEKDEIFQVGVDGKEHLSIDFLRKYVAYAKRHIHPDLDENAKNNIHQYYLKTRQTFGQEDQNPGPFQSDAEKESIVPITARVLESLIRLSEAHARMHLREVATKEDAAVAIAVFSHWRDESKIEDESELYSGVSGRQRIVREVIRNICMERDGTAHITEIFNRCSARKVDERAVEEAIGRMRESGELFMPRNDSYSFSR